LGVCLRRCICRNLGGKIVLFCFHFLLVVKLVYNIRLFAVCFKIAARPAPFGLSLFAL
jgi:hypothetical protein